MRPIRPFSRHTPWALRTISACPFDTFIVRHRVENTLKLYANQKRLMYLVSDQDREKEENSNLMVGILSHVVEFRNHEGGDHIRNIRGITELLLRRLVEKTKAYPPF